MVETLIPPLDEAAIRRNNAEVLNHYESEVRVATSYTTIVTGAGYAGLIAVWSGLRNHIDRCSLLASAVLIAISILSFVLLEVAKARIVMNGSARFNEIVGRHFRDQDFPTFMAAGRAEAMKATLVLNKYQPLSFWVSVVTGVSAAVWIVSACILGIVSGV